MHKNEQSNLALSWGKINIRKLRISISRQQEKYSEEPQMVQQDKYNLHHQLLDRAQERKRSPFRKTRQAFDVIV